MSTFEVTVEMPVEITFTIDTDHISDWDGRDLMHVHENSERWAAGAPIERDLALAVMAAQIVDRGRLAGTDGWADFNDDATSNGWPHFQVDDAYVSVRETTDPRRTDAATTNGAHDEQD